MSQAIASLPYLIFERVVKNQAQKTIVHHHEMHLFGTEITTSQDKFSIHNVSDISSRMISGEEGFLYLHTNKGVYPYIIRTNPRQFIRAFKDLKLDLK